MSQWLIPKPLRLKGETTVEMFSVFFFNVKKDWRSSVKFWCVYFWNCTVNIIEAEWFSGHNQFAADAAAMRQLSPCQTPTNCFKPSIHAPRHVCMSVHKRRWPFFRALWIIFFYQEFVSFHFEPRFLLLSVFLLFLSLYLFLLPLTVNFFSHLSPFCSLTLSSCVFYFSPSHILTHFGPDSLNIPSVFTIISLPSPLSVSYSSHSGWKSKNLQVPAAVEQTASCQQGHTTSPYQPPLLVRNAHWNPLVSLCMSVYAHVCFPYIFPACSVFLRRTRWTSITWP